MNQPERAEFLFARYSLGALLGTPVMAGIMFLSPPAVAAVLVIASNLFALRQEWRFGQINPITYCLLAVGVGLGLTGFFVDDLYDSYFFPTIVFGALAVTSSVLMLFKEPFSNFLGTSIGNQRTHFIISGLWIVTYWVGFGVCLYIPNNILLYFVPPILVALSAAATLYIHLYLGKNRLRADIDKSVQIECLPNDLEQIYEMYLFSARQRMETRRQKSAKQLKTAEQIATSKLDGLKGKTHQIASFVTRDDKGLRGSIYCYPEIDGLLPSEKMFPELLTMKQVRKFGRPIEIGHFAIRRDARRSRELPLALLSTALNQAILWDTGFILLQAHPSAEMLYRKLGCEPLIEGFHEQPGVGFPVTFQFLNLEKRIVMAEEPGAETHFRDLLNQKALEFYVKRRAFASLFGRKSLRHFSTLEIVQLIQPTLSTSAAFTTQKEVFSSNEY